MAIQEIEIDCDTDQLSPEITQWLVLARQRVSQYWDQFKSKPLPQYIECDFDLVAAGLQECVRRDLPDGKLFVEWGCGFGVVTGIASILGLDAVGVEAEEFLCGEGRALFERAGIQAEIWQGNFLPNGARDLADDEDPLVSLTHYIPAAYEEHDFTFDDFALVFAYPWPGEEHFLKLVFDRFARSGALMLMYRGPFMIELYRKR